MLGPLRNKIRFTGYITPELNRVQRQPIPSLRKKAILTMGGGEDGTAKIQQYLDALRLAPSDWDSHIVTGPLMDKAQVRHFRRQVQKSGLADQVRISHFHADMMSLLQSADAVVSMAGYNSCAEILKTGTPAVLMPRTHPRKEQLIRAQRLQELGLAKCITSDDAGALRSAVETALAQKQGPGYLPNLNGRQSMCRIIESLFSERFGAPASGHNEPALAAAE